MGLIEAGLKMFHCNVYCAILEFLNQE